MPAQFLKRGIRSLIGRMGFDLVRANPELLGVSMDNDLKRLLHGHQVDTLFDIGANVGQTVDRFKSLYPDAAIHCFEPGNDAVATLRERFGHDRNVVINHHALGAESGDRDFYESKNTDMNSLLSPSEDHIGLLADKTTVSVSTLDQYIQSHEIKEISILKSDTQGSDLDVIRGGCNSLASGLVRAIAVEILFHDVYQDAPEVDEIYRFLRNADYRLVGFYSPQFRGNCVGCMDGLFIHESLYDNSRDRWQRNRSFST